MKIAATTIFFLLASTANFVSADKKLKGAKARDCELEEKKDEVKFKCKAKVENEDDGTELKDEIKFKISADDDILKVKVEYEQEVETEESEVESETQYEVHFDRLVEYQKSATSTLEDAYDFEEDIIVKETVLVMGPLGDVTESDGDYIFSISSRDNVATFTFKISPGGENSTDVLANKMKIDFELLDYLWDQPDTEIALISSVETKRKIEVEYEDEEKEKKEDDDDDDEDDDLFIETKRKIEVEYEDEEKEKKEDDDDDDEDDDDDDDEEDEVAVASAISPDDRKLKGSRLAKSNERKLKGKSKKTTDVKISFADALDLTGISVFGEYSWATEATMNMNDTVANNETTQVIEVIATSPSEEDTPVEDDGKTVSIIAFSFVNAGGAMDIYWDPEVGVAYGDSSSASSFLMGGSVISLAIGVVAGFVALTI
eukprot:CAMPEP_0172471880 /NCGR_PEP_ID=MMETSP1065-20121228/68045_1 /TAXON_ID=265537 /ORGANISM="Amphiprora paludosa, Strain CCMP125" /LENGTH=429 /DNA_ID=CAMNT_0013229995 /DNA_START=328 /DNA_END=1618 /DNA_ORIENTATION=+